VKWFHNPQSFVSFGAIKSYRMKKILLCCLVLLVFSCKKKTSHEQIEADLKTAMLKSLYNAVGNDSSKVKYQIREVYFFEEKDFYDCEFRVQMNQTGHDTLGVMKAAITKDFSKVTRAF
jgi:hypothetical protein